MALDESQRPRRRPRRSGACASASRSSRRDQSQRGEQGARSISLSNIGFHLIDQGDLAAAQAPLELALALSREVGSDSLEAFALVAMGRLAERRGDYQRARTLATEALAMFRRLASPAEEVEQMLALARISSPAARPEYPHAVPDRVVEHEQEAGSTQHCSMPGCHGRSSGQGDCLGKGCTLFTALASISAK